MIVMVFAGENPCSACRPGMQKQGVTPALGSDLWLFPEEYSDFGCHSLR